MTINSSKKIYNEFGFLDKSARSFVEDGFGRELRKILATAEEPNDILVISSILKSMVGDAATNLYTEMIIKSTTSPPTPKLTAKLHGTLKLLKDLAG